MRGQRGDVGDVGSGTELSGAEGGAGQAAETEDDDEESLHATTLPEGRVFRQGACHGGNRDRAAQTRDPLRSGGAGGMTGGFAWGFHVAPVLRSRLCSVP
jgi:hypothetical protein